MWRSTPLQRRTELERGQASLRRTHIERKTAARKRAGISAAHRFQRQKVAGQPCLVCEASPCDPAHLVSRSLGGCDAAACVLPMCRQHHRLHEDGKLDILPLLWPRFKAELQHALEHVDPVSLIQIAANDRVEWQNREAA